MTLTPDDIHKFFIVKRTQVEMMADRGLLVPEEELVMFIENQHAERPTGQLYTEFVQRYKQDGRFSREALTETYKDDNDVVTYVYFVPPTIKDKQGIGVVSAFITTLTEIGAENGIIITQEDFTPEAKKALEVLTSPIIQVFFDYQLYLNPTKHNYVPRHVRLSEEERQVFFEKSRTKPGQLLTFSIDDPVVRYHGWNVGDIIMVERLNLATSKTMVKSSLVPRIVGRNKFDQLKTTASKAKVVATAEEGGKKEKD